MFMGDVARTPKRTVSVSLPAQTMMSVKARGVNLSAFVEQRVRACGSVQGYNWPQRPRGRPTKGRNPMVMWGPAPQKVTTTISLTNDSVRYLDQVRKARPNFDFSFWVLHELNAAGVY